MLATRGNAGPQSRLRELAQRVRAQVLAETPVTQDKATGGMPQVDPGSGADEGEKKEEVVVALVQNIPAQLHSLDLRLFFSDWIERGKFKMFHYLHRSEVLTSSATSAADSSSTSSVPPSPSDPSPGVSGTSNQTGRNPLSSKEKKEEKEKTCCCVVELYSQRDFVVFKRRYHRRLWTDRAGDMIPRVCIVHKVKRDHQDSHLNEDRSGQGAAGRGDGIDKEDDQDVMVMGMTVKSSKYLTRRQRMEKARRSISERRSLVQMPELHPPKALLPQGNVGTPLKWIQERVRECAFPSSLLRKLGIHALRRRKYRRYGEVHLDYSLHGGDGEGEDDDDGDDDGEGRWEYTFDKEASEDRNKTSARPKPVHQYHLHKRGADDDDDDEWPDEPGRGRDSEGDQDAEEWERHEALQHDDHEEYLFEQEIELKWEKGGSGLVFWTDGVYWDAQDDGKDADQFDLDTAHYYDRTGGDDDHLYGASQNQYDDQESGCAGGKAKRKDGQHGEGYGEFERHTTGFGSRMLKQYGWEEGRGVGRTPGIPRAIEPATQMDTTGLGYGPEGRAGRRKRKRRAKTAPRPRPRDDEEEDEEEGGHDEGRRQVRRVIVYPPRGATGRSGKAGGGSAALVHDEQLRRWRMRTDPSYVAIGTVYDHPGTNPLLPPDYYDDDDDEEEGQSRKGAAEAEAEAEAKRRRQFDEVVLMPSFPTKPFVRGGTIQEEREALKRN